MLDAAARKSQAWVRSHALGEATAIRARTVQDGTGISPAPVLLDAYPSQVEAYKYVTAAAPCAKGSCIFTVEALELEAEMQPCVAWIATAVVVAVPEGGALRIIQRRRELAAGGTYAHSRR